MPLPVDDAGFAMTLARGGTVVLAGVAFRLGWGAVGVAEPGDVAGRPASGAPRSGAGS